MKKKPKTKYYPEQKKVPRIASQIDPEKLSQKKPSWRVGTMDLSGPFGWQGMGMNDLLEVQEKLKNFESQTWQEIEKNGK